MKTIDCIKARRSRRLFLDKKVPEKLVSQILECAISAPSSVNCQPWHFVIVKDKDAKEKLANLKSEDNQKHILTAPVSIVVCVDKDKSPKRFIEDGVTATMNILLAAHDLGLGAVYVTGCNLSEPKIAKDIKEALFLPEDIIPIAIVPIGYADPSEELEKKELVRLKDVVHFDKW